MDEFVLPTSADDAEQRRQDITLDIQTIQSQLGDRDRTDTSGQRLSKKRYWEWKTKAQFTLNQKLAELRTLKQWIHQQRASAQYTSEDDTRGHLQGLYLIIQELQEEGVDFDPDETAAIKAAKTFLDHLDASTNPTAA